MKNKKKKTVRELKSLMGRQDWNGIKPVEKVIPSKKKPISTRKRKHKGRESDPYLFLGFTNTVANYFSSL